MKTNNLLFTYTDFIPFIQNKEKNFWIKQIYEILFNLNQFTLNSSINTTTMIISRSIIKNLKFKNIKKLEDYLFKCHILKQTLLPTNLINHQHFIEF